MLDLKFVREQPDAVRDAANQKRIDVSIDRILEIDGSIREKKYEVDELRAEKNRLSSLLGKGIPDTAEKEKTKETVREMNVRIKEIESDLKPLQAEMDELMIWLPNIPHTSVPRGTGADDNQVVRSWGEMPVFDFDPVAHWEIAAMNGFMDFDKAPKLAGSNFSLFRGDGANLVRGLLNMMLDIHTKEHGYTEYWTPFVATRQNMIGTGQLPKLEEDMYICSDPELFLIPTGEVPLTNIFRDEIMSAEDLPVRVVAYTPCFRREAGAYGKETRGLNRVHQFDKVEMVRIVEPETSYNELESLVTDAEEILKRLELPYRILNLCTGELSFAAAKCYDIEVWAAGQKRWLEVSSCSNFEDFQARRCMIRYRPHVREKPRFVHTLNGSGLALPRIIAALIENNQTREGVVRIPEYLRAYVGNKEYLGGETEKRTNITW